MKKLLSVISLCVLGLSATACDSTEYKVALVTDSGTINDGSFNESAWNGINEYANTVNANLAEGEEELSVKYYQPSAETDSERWTSIQLAVRGGAEIVVLPGYLFNTVICDASVKYPEVKFLLIDGSYTADTEFGEVYDDTLSYDNVYCVNYQEEQAGFLAGYASVTDGYTDLGFFGGMAVPAVVKFGYGYLQGISAAADALEKDVNVTYTYAGQFYADAATDTKMATWASSGVEVIFACGGGIYQSVVKASTSTNNLKMIGVDVDQVDVGELVITSAIKNMKDTVVTTLETLYAGNWDSIGGTDETLGLGKNVIGNVEYVGLPTEQTSWGFKTFDQSSYNSIVSTIQYDTYYNRDTIYNVKNTVESATTDAAFKTLLGLSDRITITYQA